MKQRKFLKTATPYLFIMPWIIGFLVFTIGPLILSLIMSFLSGRLPQRQHSGDLETILICLQRTNSSGNPL